MNDDDDIECGGGLWEIAADLRAMIELVDTAKTTAGRRLATRAAEALMLHISPPTARIIAMVPKADAVEAKPL
ncbi:hypothetical protein [Roseixanthobacter glucoisosaccharinicivorans]|uniref:hypothetical protein n=1 Tax=Roseixanthobacter glucoisosaccharinicivorans TaxID=3119923 RepID=UPI00372B65DA